MKTPQKKLPTVCREGVETRIVVQGKGEGERGGRWMEKGESNIIDGEPNIIKQVAISCRTRSPYTPNPLSSTTIHTGRSGKAIKIQAIVQSQGRLVIHNLSI